MAQLDDVFERLRSLLAVARDEHDNEMKIGELFVRAQDHVNQAVADAEERTRQLLADAEREAARIVTAAKKEAKRLLEGARKPAIPPAVTDQLQKTIEGFARVNTALQSELNSLVETLTEKAPTAPALVAHAPAPGHVGGNGDSAPAPSPSPSPRRRPDTRAADVLTLLIALLPRPGAPDRRQTPPKESEEGKRHS